MTTRDPKVQPWTKDEIWANIQSSNKWLFRGIMAIYNQQTYAEQNSDMTKEDNGVGFNAFNAPFLSDIAKKIEKGQRLTEGQLQAARKSMRKYCGQLARIANKKI